MNIDKTNLKYIIEIAIIYLLFKYIPNEKLNDKHIILIAVIAIMLHAIADNASGIQNNINKLQNQTQTCNNTCKLQPKVEKLEVVAQVKQNDNNIVPNESHYSYTDYNTLPNTNQGIFEYGYSFLPPANWYSVPPHPPICITEKQCPVCPIYIDNSTADLKEWNSPK
jgi:hypothetical protein